LYAGAHCNRMGSLNNTKGGSRLCDSSEDAMTVKQPESELLRRLFSEAQGGKRFSSIYQMPSEPDSQIAPLDILTALGITSDSMSDTATAALAAINELTSTEPSQWMDFRWKLTALSYVEDILDAVIYPSESPLVWL